MQKHYGYNIEITHNSCNIIYSNNSLVIVKILQILCKFKPILDFLRPLFNKCALCYFTPVD